MFTHCGKKLLFMGQDFGQDCEWSEERELEWHYLEDKEHSSMKYYTQKLLEIYNKYPCLSENDNNWKSFEWINADDKDRSIYSYMRKSENGRNNILVVLNMTPMERKDYQLGVDKKKKYKLLLNSDDVDFGGNGGTIPKEITAKAVKCDNKPYSLTFDLPAYGAALFLF